MPAQCLRDTDVAILAGGLGTRLRSVIGQQPKILARIGEVPVLRLLLEWLLPFAPRKVVMCLGYRADAVKSYLAELHWNAFPVETIVEKRPLGTAGALRLASSELASDPVLAMNGDSFVAADLCQFLGAHRAAGASGSLLCCRVMDSSRYGAVTVDSKSRIREFREKAAQASSPCIVNAGVYLLGRELMEKLRKGTASSLEREFFPSLAQGTLFCHAVDADFIDIGTPDSYARAPEAMRDLISRAAGRA